MTTRQGARQPREGEQESIPLAMAKPGAVVRVVALGGCRAMVHHLAGMGVRRGVRLLVVAAGNRGPVIVELRGCRYIIGRGMARQIMVAPCVSGVEQAGG